MEAGDLGVQPGEGKPLRAGASGSARRARARRLAAMVQGHAVVTRSFAGALGARIRALPARAMAAWELRQLLEAARHLHRWILRQLRRCTADAHVELVRRLYSYRDRKLRRAQ